MRTYHIAWCNLENLFDEENAIALGRRTDKVFRAIKNDIAGWTAQLRDRKIDQLATVIAAMNTGNGPDLLGVCEVENRFVVDRLVEKVKATLPAPRSNEVVHADTGDERGIDVAFIYDDTLFQVPLPLEGSVLFHVVMRRNATRGIVQVNFEPRRRPPGLGPSSATIGPAAAAVNSSPRATAPTPGRRSAIPPAGLEVHGPQTPVLAMGDFNDEPFDTSLVRHALSTRQRVKVTNARENPLLWNLMWPNAGLPDGSFYFDNQPNMLDQFWSTGTWPPLTL